MKIKADWDSYLHDLRVRQFQTVFACCPEGAFPRALELGAGDGFVSTLLAPLCGDLVSTDINPHRLLRRGTGNITYQICDAEQVGEAFPADHFDLVFSFALLEHLDDCERALKGIHRVLANDGLTVHYLPNRWWKAVTVLLHVPNKLAKAIDRLLAGHVFHRARQRKKVYTGNNPKRRRKRRFFLWKLLLPRVHGASDSTLAEFLAFGRRRWLKQFADAGFEVLAVRKGGFNSGYGFGCPRWRRLMEWLGVHTESAYIARKAGCVHRGVGELA